MRLTTISMFCGLTILLAAGCAGPEQKLGRGVLNLTEFVRMGELRRSMEQQSLYGSTDTTYTTGFIRGFNRSVARTLVGAFEVATFPLPTPSYSKAPFSSDSPVYPDPNYRNKRYPFGGLVLQEDPPYPDSYKPGLMEDSTFATDTSLGFSGGDIAPFIPGSRFRIFDN